jgi:hypothetical protein
MVLISHNVQIEIIAFVGNVLALAFCVELRSWEVSCSSAQLEEVVAELIKAFWQVETDV